MRFMNVFSGNVFIEYLFINKKISKRKAKVS